MTVCVALAIPLTTEAQDYVTFLSKEPPPPEVRASLRTRSYVQTDVSDQGADLQMNALDFSLSAPLWRNDTTSFELTTRFSALDIETRARLPKTFKPLPDSLWDVGVGVDVRHELANGWTAGGGLTLGSAGDRLFASADEWTVNASGYLRVPIDERDAWLFMLNVSNTRDFAPFVPLPGIGYAFDRGEQWNGVIGAPLTHIHYEPVDKWAFDLTYVMMRTVHARVSYQPLPAWELFAAFDWDSRTYFRHDRRDSDDRLYYVEKRAMGGFSWRIRDNVRLAFAAGYAFDRFFFEADGYDDRGDSRIDIGDGAVMELSLAISF